MRKLRNKKGFTLIELVVVMIILAILAAIVIPQLGSFRANAERSTCQANQRILDSATAMWRAEDIKANGNNTKTPSIGTDLKPYLTSEVFCPTSGGADSYRMDNGIWTCDAGTGKHVHARTTTTP